MSKLIPLLLILLLTLFLNGCGGETKQLVKGQPVPAFSLETLNSSKVNFPADLNGKIVSIRFWADWCPFCESEMNLLEPVYQKYKDKGLVILAINVRQDRKAAEKFIQKLDISYDVLLDPTGEIARDYGVMGLPTSFFVDKKGVLQQRILGESTAETFEEIVLDLMRKETK